ncbi:ABC transporter transmembrane domain-containing protein [Treponema pedis]|uniref:ABC transporter transmembrane domain-containing protein n=1 Tax=Treponema pedis TaxID=409322 RepID=UPI0004181E4F|nr:ABC transporter ATP-binding protein [Treponema pedis]
MLNTKLLTRWSVAFIKPFFPVLFFLLCFSLIVNYASTFEPFFTGKIIDALTLKDRAAFFTFLKIIILFQIAGLVFSLLGSWFQFLLQRKMTVYTESRLYLNVLHIPPKGSEKKNVGTLLNLFSSDLGTMTGIYTTQIPSIITTLVMMIVFGFRLFQIDVFLFCLTLIVSVIPVFLAKYFGTKQAEVNKEQKKQQDLYTLFMTESIHGLQDIKNYSSQKFFIQKFKNILNTVFIHVKKSTIIGMQSSAASFFTNFTINISLFAIVGLTVLVGKNTVGTITAALMYSQKFRGLVSFCAETYKSIIVSFVSVERLKTIFDERQKHSSVLQQEKDNSKIKKLQIKNLSFSYNKNKNVFTNLNAEFFFPGLYLIKGENGSGKTTLLNIIAENINTAEKSSIRGKIIFSNLEPKPSYVSQTPFIFSESIEENICFGKLKNKTEMEKVLVKTKLNRIIASLPGGINTKLGSGDYILSQGQMQRLALSRCLLQKSEIILFDEIENALDTETSIALTEILSELKTDKLILMITHKNNYDKIADKIFYIK